MKKEVDDLLDDDEEWAKKNRGVSPYMKSFIGYRQFYTTYYITLSFLASIVLAVRNDLDYVDALFLCVSAITGTGRSHWPL